MKINFKDILLIKKLKKELKNKEEKPVTNIKNINDMIKYHNSLIYRWD